MDNISTRISQLISVLGIKKKEFAKRLDLSQPFVSELCSGVKKPSKHTIADICKEFNVEERWLRTGEGEMFVQSSRAQLIGDFLGDVLADAPDSIRSQIVTGLAQLDAKDWQNIAAIIRKFRESKETKTPPTP